MSIHAKLYIDEIEYTILKFDFDFQKTADVNGRPSTKYTGGLFNFTIESVNRTDILLWSVNPLEMKEVKLVISPNHNNGKSRTILLGDAICLSFTNEYFSEDNQPLKEYFTVSPGYMLQNGQLIFEKNWKRTDLTANVEATSITSNEEEVLEPKILDQYWLDEDEQTRIEEAEINKHSVLYIKLKNIEEGEEINIVLEDADDDPTNNIKLKGIVNDNGEAILHQ